MKPYLKHHFFAALAVSAGFFSLSSDQALGFWPTKKDKQANEDSQKPTKSFEPSQATKSTPTQQKTGAAVPAAPQPKPFVRASKAERDAILRSDYLTQATFFNEQFSQNPTDSEAAFYLSTALRALSRFDEAIATADKALLFKPTDKDLLMAKAKALITADRAFYALDTLAYLISLDPKNVQAYNLQGVALQGVKRLDEAEKAWQKALSLSPEHPLVLNNMATARLTDGQFEEAEKLLRRAAVSAFSTVQVRQNLALVLGLQGKMTEAEALIRRDLPPAQADEALEWLRQRSVASSSSSPEAPPTNLLRSWENLKAQGG